MVKTVLLDKIARQLQENKVSADVRRIVYKAIDEAFVEIRTRESYTPAVVCEKMAQAAECTVADLRGRSRKAEYTVPRSVAMYILYKEIGRYSYSTIGRYFKRHYSTVIWAVQHVEDRLRVHDDTVIYYYSLYKQAL